MITKFEVGKYYKWIGPAGRPSGWNFEGYMDAMLDGRPHKCIRVGTGARYAMLEGTEYRYQATWNWGEGIQHIIICSGKNQPELFDDA